MSTAAPRGRIVSFYSFKGGVGRTMALANVAFLAAMNNLKVLVMDWDLEAPGLHQYFRGIMETEDMRNLKEAPGVLDLAWEWRLRVSGAASAQAIDAVFADFRSGAPFERRTTRVFTADEFEDEGLIDMIPAGGRDVETPEPVEYERALAGLSWNDFIETYAGGGMLDALRSWATHAYDLVLIDSRTGLADVAGICTMQLPDAVVLAFVLNRQNIEGVSRVAGAIRQARGEAVKVWPVPMRVSREGTAEEADASARATRELVRIGGLSKDQVEREMRGLLIKAEPNVPFMESLSPFNDTDAALDPLTANLARLTREITGVDIHIPVISDRWRDAVQVRLAPALSTDSYLRQLMTAEPLRAARELYRYVEGALATVADGEAVTDEYVTALVETSFAMQQRGDDVVAAETHDTAARVNTLLRKLYDADHDKWRSLLAESLQTSLDASSDLYFPDDEASALEEIDELLAGAAPTVPNLAQRAENRLRLARAYAAIHDPVQQLSAAEDALAHLQRARRESGGDVEDMQILRHEAMLQKAEAQERLEHPEDATETLRRVVKATDTLIEVSQRADAVRLSFEANYRLMRIARQRQGAAKEAAQYARAATSRAQAGSILFLSRVAELGAAIVAGPSPGPGALNLLRKAVTDFSTSSAANFFGRAPRGAASFIDAITGLLITGSDEAAGSHDKGQLVELACGVVEEVFRAAARRITGQMGRPGRSHGSTSTNPMAPLLAEVAGRFVEVAEPLLPRAGEPLGILKTNLAEFAQQVNASVSRSAWLRPAGKP